MGLFVAVKGLLICPYAEEMYWDERGRAC